VIAPDVERLLRSIAANVRKHRARLGLTQEELGEATGLSYRYLQDIEAGRKNVTVDTLVRLARVLRVRPVQMMASAHLSSPRVGRPKVPRKSK
jgi:transcriptional regulator with XRE-family HTH domain